MASSKTLLAVLLGFISVAQEYIPFRYHPTALADICSKSSVRSLAADARVQSLMYPSAEH